MPIEEEKEATINHGTVIKQLTEAHDGLVSNLNDIFEDIDKRIAAIVDRSKEFEQIAEALASAMFLTLGKDMPQEILDDLQRHAEATGAILPDVVMDFLARDKPRH